MGVGDSGALFFVGDFSVEIAGHACEFRHHGLDLLHPTPLFVGLEPLEANKRVSRFHHYALRTTTTGGKKPPRIQRHETARRWRRKVAHWLAAAMKL
jgi:hypothetical protein